ncbi:MAG TPA: CHAD domain-containing protein [Vicinamibacterales bacterium]|nr:CHAD domain-containing protein [Vicinamibacterales bacterium]
MNTSTSCDRLWRKRLNELSSVWPDFVGGRPTGLHKTRVASRRIREALPIVSMCAPPAKVKKLNRKMRELTRYLGPIRELDVELGLLEDESKTENVPGRAIEILRREIVSKRQALRDDLAANAPVGDVKKLIRKLERIGSTEEKRKKEEGKGKKADGKQESEWRGVLATRLLRRAKTLRAALSDAGPIYAPERIHGVRIATKKLRYALEIARDAGVSGAAPLVRTLKRQQERLGQLHDLQTLLKHVREAEALPGVGLRVNDLTLYADTLERECRRLHAAFVEHRDELAACVKAVRQNLVPALTTPPRRQARAGVARPAVPARVRAKS